MIFTREKLLAALDDPRTCFYRKDLPEIYEGTERGAEVIDALVAAYPRADRPQKRAEILTLVDQLVAEGLVEGLNETSCPQFEVGQWVKVVGLLPAHLQEEGLQGVTATIEQVNGESVFLADVDWPLKVEWLLAIDPPAEDEWVDPPKTEPQKNYFEEVMQSLRGNSTTDDSLVAAVEEEQDSPIRGADLDTWVTTTDAQAVEAEVIVPMGLDEARRCIEEIKAGFQTLRHRVWELKQREGWKVLGYGSMRKCLLAEFGEKSESQIYRELVAASIETVISPIGEIGLIPESVLRPLSKLPDAQRAEAFLLAKQLSRSEDGMPTARDVQSVVDIFKSPRFTPPVVDDQTRSEVKDLQAAQPLDEPVDRKFKKGDRVLLLSRVAGLPANTKAVIAWAPSGQLADLRVEGMGDRIFAVQISALELLYAAPPIFNQSMLDLAAENLARAGVTVDRASVALHMSVAMQVAIELLAGLGGDEEWLHKIFELALDREVLPGKRVKTGGCAGTIASRTGNKVAIDLDNRQRWDLNVLDFEANGVSLGGNE